MMHTGMLVVAALGHDKLSFTFILVAALGHDKFIFTFNRFFI